jgi:hypothetical protein
MIVKVQAPATFVLTKDRILSRYSYVFTVQGEKVRVQLRCPSNRRAEVTAILPIEEARDFWADLCKRGYRQW